MMQRVSSSICSVNKSDSPKVGLSRGGCKSIGLLWSCGCGDDEVDDDELFSFSELNRFKQLGADVTTPDANDDATDADDLRRKYSFRDSFEFGRPFSCSIVSCSSWTVSSDFRFNSSINGSFMLLLFKCICTVVAGES